MYGATDEPEPDSYRQFGVIVAVNAIFPIFCIDSQAGTSARPQSRMSVRPGARGHAVGPDSAGGARLDAVAASRHRAPVGRVGDGVGTDPRARASLRGRPKRRNDPALVESRFDRTGGYGHAHRDITGKGVTAFSWHFAGRCTGCCQRRRSQCDEGKPPSMRRATSDGHDEPLSGIPRTELGILCTIPRLFKPLGRRAEIALPICGAGFRARRQAGNRDHRHQGPPVEPDEVSRGRRLVKKRGHPGPPSQELLDPGCGAAGTSCARQEQKRQGRDSRYDCADGRHREGSAGHGKVNKPLRARRALGRLMCGCGSVEEGKRSRTILRPLPDRYAGVGRPGRQHVPCCPSALRRTCRITERRRGRAHGRRDSAGQLRPAE